MPSLPPEKTRHFLVTRLTELSQGANPLQARMANFLLQNTVPHRWDPENRAQTEALRRLVWRIGEGDFPDWGDFSQALLSFTTVYPITSRKKP